MSLGIAGLSLLIATARMICIDKQALLRYGHRQHVLRELHLTSAIIEHKWQRLHHPATKLQQPGFGNNICCSGDATGVSRSVKDLTSVCMCAVPALHARKRPMLYTAHLGPAGTCNSVQNHRLSS